MSKNRGLGPISAFTMIEMMITVAIGAVLVTGTTSTFVNIFKANQIIEDEFNRFNFASKLFSQIHDSTKLSLSGLEACTQTNHVIDCRHMNAQPVTVGLNGQPLTGVFYNKRFEKTTISSDQFYELRANALPYCRSGQDCDMASYIRLSIKLVLKAGGVYAEYMYGISPTNFSSNTNDGCVGANGSVYYNSQSQSPWLTREIKNGQFICDIQVVPGVGEQGDPGRPAYQDTEGEVINDPWWL